MLVKPNSFKLSSNGKYVPVDPVKYVGWVVTTNDDGTADAERQDSWGKTVLKMQPIPEFEGNFEGWIFADAFDRVKKTVAITGICLFDARWTVKLHKKKNTYKLGSENDKSRLFKALREGYPMKAMHVPRGMGLYHTQVITWVTSKIRLHGTRKVLIHVPTNEYHHYLRELEAAAGRGFPEVHIMIEEFACEVKKMYLGLLKGVEVVFIDPYKHAESPMKSFGLPYKKPELFGVDSDSVYGVEDFNEAKIPLVTNAESQKKVPTLVATVAGFPKHHFFSVKTNNDNSYRIGFDAADSKQRGSSRDSLPQKSITTAKAA